MLVFIQTVTLATHGKSTGPVINWNEVCYLQNVFPHCPSNFVKSLYVPFPDNGGHYFDKIFPIGQMQMSKIVYIAAFKRY